MTEKDFVSGVYRTLGTHSNEDREQHDFYATEPKAVELLLEVEEFNKNILEPCCGKGHISDVLKEHGYEVSSYDLVDRGYGEVKDFFNFGKIKNTDIITNPPYRKAQEFVEKSLEIVDEGAKVAMFLKTLFLESKSRKKLFTENPPKTIYVSSSRLICAKNGDFEKYKGSAVSYSWFVWEKGFKGNTTIKWIN